MLNPNLTLDDASGDDITFNLTSQGRDGTTRTDTTSVPGASRVLNIRHTQTGNQRDGVTDRHLVQIVHEIPTPNGPKVVTVNFTVNIPRDSNVSWNPVLDDVAVILDLITDGALVNPMTSTNLTALFRGES